MSEAVIQTEKSVGVEVTSSAFKSVCLDAGGNIVVEGTPARIVECTESHTGRALKEVI